MVSQLLLFTTLNEQHFSELNFRPSTPNIRNSHSHIPYRWLPCPPQPTQRNIGISGGGESDPVLIARSSTELYRYEDHNFKFWFPNGPIIPEDKVISAIGSHPILAAYNKHLRPKVREALASVPWQTIGIVRLGFADNEDNPPVVLETIKEENAEENIVQAAVDRIRNIMVE